MVSDPVVLQENPLFELAEKFILQTSRSVFLTGKAGTGKTTFLRKIKASTSKNAVVVAPTGVAAINAGGTTIHSFFQLPFSPFVPIEKGPSDRNLSDRYSLLRNLRIESEKRNVFRDLDLLIIDEVSMVRADVLDSIDVVLRHFRRKEYLPFGGVQVLYIGDLFQLPPVVQQQEWSILQKYYQSPFFFDANVIKESPPLYIELKKIFRQRDERFIEILNRVRFNEVTRDDIELLNSRYDPDFLPAREAEYITLTTHNEKANRINSDELARLTDHELYFDATVEGEFPERSYPTDRTLKLKIGAQVMFIKNDLEKIRRYYNGKIGTVSMIDDSGIFVVFPGEQGELEVEKATWSNAKYTYNSGNRSIEEEVVGTFTQYPLRLAWAITIHKSQGLTFEKAIVDAGSSFAAGQVYVALSRCTSLEGLVLRSRIFRQSVMTDERVLDFAAEEMSEDKLMPILGLEKQQYLVDGLIRIFDFSIAEDEVHYLKFSIDKKKTLDKDEAFAILQQIEDILVRHQEVATKFSNQLRALVSQQDSMAIRKRVGQAVEYFTTSLEKEAIIPLSEYAAKLRQRKRVKKFAREVNALLSFLQANTQLLNKAIELAGNLGHGRIDQPSPGD
jgi:hypothetical protein